MDACRLANHLAQDVGKLGFRGTICNDEAKWEHAKVGHAPAIWFVFSGAVLLESLCIIGFTPARFYSALNLLHSAAAHIQMHCCQQCTFSMRPHSKLSRTADFVTDSESADSSTCVSAGNGSQWSKMGAPLLESSPAFRRAIRACAAALKPHRLDLLAEFGKEEGWRQPALAMVGLVAVQVRPCCTCMAALCALSPLSGLLLS